MSYLKLLELREEPFSNSPDPEFFYESPQHLDCLHRLEISIRLMRGLNVVLGEVGAGKSTLCRLLLRNLNRDAAVRSHLLLDPQFNSAKAMLEVLHSMFLGEEAPAGLSEWQLKEAVKHQLFKTAMEDGKLVVLIIDEGQKISHSCLEMLRELLNYETNNTKLLQIVIFAQTEFAELIRKHPNVADRINEYTVLGPLTFLQTRAMIRHRMARASTMPGRKDRFTFMGYLAVYRITGGYPRKIVRLCHKVMLNCILRNTTKAGWALVRASNVDVAALAKSARIPKLSKVAAAPVAAVSAPVAHAPSVLVSAAMPAETIGAGGATGPAVTAMARTAGLPSQTAKPVRTATPRRFGLAYGLAAASFVLAVGLAAGSMIVSPDPQGPVVQGGQVEQSGQGISGSVPEEARTRQQPSPLQEDKVREQPATPGAAGGNLAQGPAQGQALEPALELAPAPAQPQEQVAAVASQASVPAETSAQAPPRVLGAYQASREMPAESLLQLVYGQVSPELVRRFQALNSDLAPNTVLAAGATVQLPEVQPGEAASLDAGYVVQITQDESLQMMIEVLHGLREQGLDVAMAAQRVDDSRRLFAILQASTFQTEHAAAHALRTLPAMFQPGAKVVRDLHRKGEITLASFRKETAAMQLPVHGAGSEETVH